MSAQLLSTPAPRRGERPLRIAMPRAIAVIALLLAVLPAALGIGLAPSSVDLKPGVSAETLVFVLNTEGITAKFRVHLEGELVPYMNLSPARFELSPAIPEAVIRVQAQAPPTLPSGPRTGRLVITQLPPEGAVDSTLTAGAVLIAVFEAYIPHEGAHAEATLYVRAEGRRREAIAGLTVHNRGTQPLDVSTRIEIFDPLGRTLEVLKPPVTHIPVGGFGAPQALWQVAEAGPLRAKATLSYAGKSMTLDQAFEVGAPSVALRAIEASAFKLGKLAHLTLNVDSLWDAPLKDVQASLTFSQQGAAKTIVATDPVDLGPLAQGRLDAYWDTAGVETGAYLLTTNLTVRERTQTVEQPVWIEKDRIVFGERPPIRRWPLKRILLLSLLVLLVLFLFVTRHKRTPHPPPLPSHHTQSLPAESHHDAPTPHREGRP